jgi:hypothetical protein
MSDGPRSYSAHGPQTPVATVHVTLLAQSPSDAQWVLHPVGAAVLHPHGAQATSDGWEHVPPAQTPGG